MPIRPENRERYPANWATEIRPRILARAGNCCEGSPDFPQCRVPNGEIGGRDRRGVWCPALPTGCGLRGMEWPKPGELSWCAGSDEPLMIVRIVLTIAHLDHTPENCDDDNLRAWCQRCHLHHDRFQHAETRRARRAMGDLFGEDANA